MLNYSGTIRYCAASFGAVGVRTLLDTFWQLMIDAEKSTEDKMASLCASTESSPSPPDFVPDPPGVSWCELI